MNKVEKIKADIDKLQETTMDKNRNFWSLYHEGIFDGLSMIENFIYSLEEEPVSNDLEEASKQYALNNTPWDDCWPEVQDAFKAGIQWQKKQLIDKACEWLKSYRQDTPDGTSYIPGIINDETIEDFKKAMEE